MPAPPLESEPAMVSAIAVIAAPPLRQRDVDGVAQGARGEAGIGRHRQRRDHRDAVGAGGDHIGGVARH